jgi:rSAM/selenodomain-associated transferase 2
MASLKPMAKRPIAVIIPTLNAAGALAASLAALGEIDPAEILVVDGGSTDATRSIAQAAGVRVLHSEAGRGTQLMTGSVAAKGTWLLFLHADTVLPPGAGVAVDRFLERETGDRAGYFRFALDDSSRAARRLEFLVRWRCRLLALPYGDQGLLIHRRLYDTIGGYRRLPLMEDVDLIRRLRRKRLVAIPHPAITSADRYRRNGYLRRSLRNVSCLALYYLGLPPRLILKLYR